MKSKMKLLFERWNSFLSESEEEVHPSDYIDFKRGDCSLLANVISDELGLPIYGVFDEEGIMHHVFVYDPDVDEAIDCRGRMPVEDVFQEVRGRNLIYREVTEQEIEDTFGTYGDEEYEYAKEEAYSII